MYTVYVLHSSKYEKIFIGYTSNLKQRLHSHSKVGEMGWTVRFQPWEVVHTEEYATRYDAMQREKQLNTPIGRHYIWKLIRAKKG